MSESKKIALKNTYIKIKIFFIFCLINCIHCIFHFKSYTYKSIIIRNFTNSIYIYVFIYVCMVYIQVST